MSVQTTHLTTGGIREREREREGERERELVLSTTTTTLGYYAVAKKKCVCVEGAWLCLYSWVRYYAENSKIVCLWLFNAQRWVLCYPCG